MLALKLVGLVLIAAILATVARVTLSPDVHRYAIGPEETRVPAGGFAKRTAPYAMANYSAYAGGAPRLGDIVVVKPPVGDGNTPSCGEQPAAGAMCARPMGGYGLGDYPERVVGLPGDRLALVHGRLIRNGRPVAESYARACRDEWCEYPVPIRVLPGDYFVLSDDRGDADDSRSWGPVPRRAVLARVDDCLPVIRLFCHAKS